MSEFADMLFGKTEKVNLADGKEYTLREPCIEDLEAANFDIGKMDDIRNIKKLAWIMTRKDHPDMDETAIARRITFSMLGEKSEFLAKLFKVLGVEKNALGAANPQNGTK